MSRKLFMPWRGVAAGVACAMAVALAPAGEKSPGKAGKKRDPASRPATTQKAPRGLEPLKPKLPKPVFIGTPKNIPPGTTVEKKPTKPKPILVPKGTTNLALNRPVTSSDSEPIIGEPELLTDDDKEASDGSYLELGPGVQWVQIDLGKPCQIFAVYVWHYHGDPRVYRDVIVQVADDQDFITGVRTVFNNDHDNSAGLGIGKEREYFETYHGKGIDARGVKARYVRLYSRGSTANTQNHYTEVAVYGKPLK